MKQKDPSYLPTSIGNYKVKHKIANGGMGEIYLVYDSCCDREICLKKIREDRLQYPTLKDRFLREAKIASQMTHPSIIPIYNIHTDSSEVYYTMPYIEGETLKQILKHSLEEEKSGKITHPLGSSIHSLLRIFMNVCQAIAYCHSRGVLHRDIKPDNIIVGKFGETFILDWGLADFINDPLQDGKEKFPAVERVDLTKPGKIPGTLAYIPPERVFGKPSSCSTDIYALGVVLYQLLTLKLPFHRTSKEKLKKQILKEQLVDPINRSPYRDIPLELSRIAKKCLNPDPDLRYLSVNELLVEIESFIAGKGSWILANPVDVCKKLDWQFQENFLVEKHSAITSSAGLFEWVTIMISKKGVRDNFQLETYVELKEQSQGIGFLLNIPEIQERKGILQDGNYIWIGSTSSPGCFLFRSNVQIMSVPDISLKPNQKYKIRIEKVDCHMRLLIDDNSTLDYLTQIPQCAPHFGIVLKDNELHIDPIKISLSSLNIMVNCLKIPDSFYANNNFAKALTEYRKISDSFPGRMEGREAQFRAGITLLEMANKNRSRIKKNALFCQSLQEFEKLRHTPSAPMEYLGKSLVYKANNEIEEEVKCLDLSLRKYSKHPLRYLLEEELVFRLHEAAYQDRVGAYHFALLCLRHISYIFEKIEHKVLYESLIKNITPIPFLQDINYAELHVDISVRLSFFLSRHPFLIELIQSSKNIHIINNCMLCLLYFDYPELVLDSLHTLAKYPELKGPIEKTLKYLQKEEKKNELLTFFKNNKSPQTDRLLILLIEKNKIKTSDIFRDDLKIRSPIGPFSKYYLWDLIEKKEYAKAKEELYSLPEMNKQLINFFKGCLLCQEKGPEKAMLFLQENKSTKLFDGYFVEKEGHPSPLDVQKLFPFERKQLFQKAALFASCGQNDTESKKWKHLSKKKWQHD